MSYNPLRNLLAIFICIVLAASCRKDDPPGPPTGPVTQQEINNWILDSMRYFYLWNQDLPAKADTQETVAFFNRLKHSADRFSIIYNPGDYYSIPRTMLYSFGMDYSVIEWPNAAGGVIGVINYVIPGSVAEQRGLKRGTYFTRINNTVLNSSNASTFTEALLRDGSGYLTPATVNNGLVTENETVSIYSGPQNPYPIHELKTFQVNTRKVGYLFYNYFHDAYNQQLLDAFLELKNAGVTELILDLRYNPGGSVAAAAQLTALIAPNVNEQSIFAKYSGNANLGQRNISFKSALSVPEVGSPIAFSSLTAGRLSLSRVFILSGPQTASAAELVINNLKPFMQVTQIGQSTYGKDKGAVIIQDARTPQRIPWVMLPITYNLSNASGTGGYTQGITPQYIINEMSYQPLSPIGDATDPLIAKAVSIMNGGGRQTAPEQAPSARVYFDTHEQPAAGSIITIPSHLIKATE
jgi:C-terminal processing protease CtpA/Prc